MIVRCNRCDLEYVHPTPDLATVRAVYQSGYFRGDGAGYNDYFGAGRSESIEKTRTRLDWLFRHGLRATDRVLDIGCADGTFLLECQRHGMDVWGVENSPEALEELHEGLTSRVVATIGEVQQHGPFELITCWDVLEHLPDPFGVLRELGSLLTPGGLLAVVVPVIENINARWMPWSWDQYKPPEHLWFFSRQSLTVALERFASVKLLDIQCAWQRNARVFSASRSRLSQRLQWVEQDLWRAIVQAGMISPRWLEDSVLMIARRRMDRG
jgi:SAM-dependent methyltransferase